MIDKKISPGDLVRVINIQDIDLEGLPEPIKQEYLAYIGQVYEVLELDFKDEYHPISLNIDGSRAGFNYSEVELVYEI